MVRRTKTPAPERRREVRRMVDADELPAQRELARRFGVSPSTVNADIQRVRSEAAPADRLPNLFGADGRPVAGQPAGEPSRAMSHGAYSEHRLAPVREAHRDALARRYPWADAGRISTQAQRLAQIEVAADWLDLKAGIVRDAEGRVWPVAESISKWSVAAERWYAEAEAERAEQTKHSALDKYLEGRAEGGDDE